MVHRFTGFEIDESQRELRADGCVLPLQPRVFDLLVYLARNRDRVVPKDELLDAVWPGVIVADGSLQRAVSLARAALASAGSRDAIRTFARHGYRFRATSTEATSGPSTLARMNGDELHRWAFESHFAGRSEETLDELEQLVSYFHGKGEHRAAASTSLLIGQLRLERREFVPAKGWHHYATRLLKQESSGREHGYADLLGCRLAILQGEAEEAMKLAQRTQAAGAQFADASLEAMGLLYLAEARLILGHTREGIAALDEAGAVVLAGGLKAWACALVYCGMIFCCMSRADWRRAGQWTEQFDRWGSDKGSIGYPMLCRLHRVEVLTVRGALMAAEGEIQTVQIALPKLSPWAEGETWRVTGDLRAALGDLEAARTAYERALAVGWDALFELALLRLQEGDPAAAATEIGSLATANAWSFRSKAGRGWAHYCIAAAQAGDLQTARNALFEVERDPDLISTPALQALVTTARAELEVAGGNALGGITLLRSALAVWLEMDAPLTAAHTHCRLAQLLMMQGDVVSSDFEFNAARLAFQRTGAQRALELCDARHLATRQARQNPSLRSRNP